MIRRFANYLPGLGIVLSMTISLLALPSTASAVVDNDPDCDNVAVIRCGAFSIGGLREKAAQGDVPKIFNAFGISQNDLKGEFVDGIVWRDGRVTVGDRVVATGAMTAGRNYGGTPIAGTNAGKYPTSKFVTEGQTAFVRMVDDKFVFAVIKACGNPISATPKSPPKPPEEPKDVKVCDLRSWKIVTIKESQFDKERYTKNLDKCHPLKVCELSTKKIITIKQGEFDKAKHSKDLNDCKPTPPPATQPADIRVCELATKQIITIKDTQFDASKHSKDLNDCQEDTPHVIADTGPGAVVAGLFGSSALGYGAFSYFQSRRNLIDKLLGR